MPFNPDEYLAEEPQKVSQFNPDEYLATSPGAPKHEMGTGEYLARKALEYGAPVAGMMGGGALGAGIGSIATGTAGYVAGKELARQGNHYLFGDELPPQTMGDTAKRLGKETLEGGVAALGGKAFETIAGAFAPAVGSAAENFATSPAITKSGEVLQKIGSKMGFKGMGRIAGYQIPGFKYVQAAGDILQGTGKAVPEIQKGIGWIVQNAPQSLGKYAGLLTKTASQGAAALGSMHFLLQQKDPEYQQVIKKMNEDGSLAGAPHE